MSTCYRNEKMEFKTIFLNLQLKLPTVSRSIMRSILPQKKKKKKTWEVGSQDGKMTFNENLLQWTIK